MIDGTLELDVVLEGEMLDAAELGLMLELTIPRLLLNLLFPLFRRLALDKVLLLEPKLGEGNKELAGVAMRVGVTSLLVMMATVVLVLLWGLMAGLDLVLKSCGLITGVKVRLGFLEFLADGAASEGLLEEIKVNSSSKSSKLSTEDSKEGVVEADWTEVGSIWPDSSSGVLVG